MMKIYGDIELITLSDINFSTIKRNMHRGGGDTIHDGRDQVERELEVDIVPLTNSHSNLS